MEGLGIAANLCAVVDLSAKIATLCVQYAKEVAGARADIERLQRQVTQLGSALRAAQLVVEGSPDQSLFTSQTLDGSFSDCIGDLQRLENKLAPQPARTAMRRLGFRALKWPFSSREVNQVLSGLERHEKTIMLGLQVDQTTALVDIREGVRQLGLRTTEDASTGRKPQCVLPFPDDPDFVKRPGLLSWMKEQYDGPARRIALIGMGGFGKSRLAIHFAHNIHADSPDTSIFWVNGSSKATFEESYRAVADVLALPRRHDPEVNVLALVRDWLQRGDVGLWLMIVDNADDVDVFFAKGDGNSSPALLASFLPKTANGKILITSRSLDAAERLTGISKATLRIPVMEEEQALELFRTTLNERVNEAAAIDLVRALDCIPLAVNQAAAYINRRSPRVTTASYLDAFRKSERRKDSLLRSDKGDLGRHDGVSNSVVVTWQVTFEQIKREQPRAADLLSLMSCFQAHNIPRNMLHSYNTDETANDSDDEEAFEDDIDVLRGYSLVTPITTELFEMHPLVQLCTRSWISEFGNSERWNRLFLRLAASHFPANTFPTSAFDTWETCQRLLPHVEPVLAGARGEEADLLLWAKLLTKVSYYLLTTGDHTRVEELGNDAVRTRRDILGADHHHTMVSMGILPILRFQQGRFGEAEKLGVELMEIERSKHGPGHLETLTSMGNLALTYRRLGRLEEAEKLEVEVTEIYKTKLGPDHPFTLESTAFLAMTHWAQGRWEKAEKLEEVGLARRKIQYGPDHPTTLLSMSHLAMIYSEQERWEEATKLEEEVLETRRMKLGPDHPDTLVSRANLSTIYLNQGRWEEALRLGEEVTEAYKTKLGLDHPLTLSCRRVLAVVYDELGRREEAEKLEVEVLEMSKVKLGSDHPDTLLCMQCLAFCWHGLGRVEDALRLMRDCVRLQRKKLGHDHPDTKLSVEAVRVWQAGRRPTGVGLGT